MTVDAGNKIIAEFMGESYTEHYELGICRCEPDGSPWDYDPIEWLWYHRDWKELMPVVEKIKDMSERFVLVQNCNSVILRSNLFNGFESHIKETGVNAVWQAVVHFIQWYNNQKTIKE